ncbi:glycoside hydrolase family 3 C-terminal domain-containing protein [Alkalibacter rhizosphaerae]|uniref:Glycoside hydrolase family 3 C-terminal domain-containing protein n=1 Tax=Alkalibacter rhizosphaerae TaxID=2815577 RepID=A0A975AJJ8_9FIRM|nr:glycoside hydrolase family 3 C-terminal domain-containing protein [Alkalibacter rhizosphaerae]
MNEKIKDLVGKMTLEEKAGMCSGKDFWNLKGVERLGIPEVMVTDGPHGLRKQKEAADHLGLNESIPAVCFPAACATAASFDKELLKTMGDALGEECQAEEVSVLLGPAVNIKRSPLCGRNFEYFSEDPYLTGKLASAFIQGVQNHHVGTSMKHFAANNQEHRRMTVSANLDERTLREIYLTGFEIAVKEAKPWSLMCSYNKINGTYSSENPYLLTQILRDEWGFEGFVVSDWGAVNERVAGLAAGLDLEMPGSGGETDHQIVEAVKEGTLSMELLDQAVERILERVLEYVDHKSKKDYDMDAHHDLAVSMEEQSAVLLKNEKNLLPLKKGTKVAFIGEFAKKPRYQGGGSSHIQGYRLDNALDSAMEWGDVFYAKGFPADKDAWNTTDVESAVEAAKRAQVAVIFAGLPDVFESEGYDRTHMKLPDAQNRVIEAVRQVQPNTVVVLHNGSPVEMPWVNDVPAILEMYLGGQGVGQACVNLLFGKANPSGKLPETFPKKLSDNPSYLNFPGMGDDVNYAEGIFVGYRYYDMKEMDVQFPFGFGLSYSTFSIGNLRMNKEELGAEDLLKVEVDVTNTGDRAGAEVVQLYVSDKTGSAIRPPRELKGFEKVFLEPGETETISFVLDRRSFSWYHEKIQDWYGADGAYDISIGSSSRDISLSQEVRLTGAVSIPLEIHRNTRMGDLLADPETAAFLKVYMEPLFSMFDKPDGGDAEANEVQDAFFQTIIMESPLRSIAGFAGLSREALDQLIQELKK